MNSREQDLLTFATGEDLADCLAEKISRLLQDAIRERNRAVLVVSGGTTPKPLFVRLARKDIPWNKVHVTLADERWVDPDEAASNEKLVRTLLLQEKAEAAHFVGLKTAFPTPEEGESACRSRLAGLPEPFDVVVLGMGNDGHTASLFPGAPQLGKALNSRAREKCLAVTPEPEAPGRMTMTLPALLAARQIFLHITGEEKLAVLKKALAGGPLEKMPVRGILLQEKVPVHIFWAP